jgi:hypothetical protein
MIRKRTRDVQEIWCGVSMQRHGKYFIHKKHRDYKNVEQRSDGGRCRGEGFKCEQGGRAQVQKCIVEEGCIEGIWCREYKR